MAPSTLMCLWSRNFPMLTPVIRITLDFRTLRSAAGSVLVRNTLWLDLNVDGQWARMGHFWKQWGRHPCLLRRRKSYYEIALQLQPRGDGSLVEIALWRCTHWSMQIDSQWIWYLLIVRSYDLCQQRESRERGGGEEELGRGGVMDRRVIRSLSRRI